MLDTTEHVLLKIRVGLSVYTLTPAASYLASLQNVSVSIFGLVDKVFKRVNNYELLRTNVITILININIAISIHSQLFALRNIKTT